MAGKPFCCHGNFSFKAFLYLIASAHVLCRGDETPLECSEGVAEKPASSSLLQTRRHHHMAPANDAMNFGGESRDNPTSGSRFDHVLLIVTRFHADKVSTLHRAYRQHFWDVVFLGPALPGEEGSNLTQQGFQVDNCSEVCRPGIDAIGMADCNYPCVGDLLHLLTDEAVTAKTAWQANLRERMRRTSLVGALVIHSDFWISPSFAMGFDFDQPWQLSKHSTCQQHDSLVEDLRAGVAGWSWWGNPEGCAKVTQPTWSCNFDLQERAREALKSEGFVVNSTVCHSWSDLYYIPWHLWPTWSRVSRIVGQKFVTPDALFPELKEQVLMNAVALPLIFETSGNHGQCKSGTCKSQDVYCWGGCCSNTNDPGDLHTNSCGHKMNLTHAPIRQALVDIWFADNPQSIRG